MTSEIRPSQRMLVLIFISLSYLLAFSQRTAPGVIGNQLQAQFHVSAAVLGTMTSIQFFLYMVLQIPVGLSGDKYGPERLLFWGVLFDGIGTLIFSQAPSFWWLLVGRAVVGLGDALIWVNIVLVLGQRFRPQEFGAMLGIVSTGGNLGAIMTTIPFAAWISAMGWQVPFAALGGLLVLVAFGDLVVLQQRKGPGRTSSTRPRMELKRISVKKTLFLVVRDRNAWATFWCHFAAVGNYIGFAGLWAVPYYMTAYHVSRTGATWFTLCAFIGALVGAPITGAISDKVGQRRMPYVFLQVASTVMWAFVPLCGGVPPEWISFIGIFIIGFGSGGSLLTFAVIRDNTAPERAGVTSGFANTGGFLSAVLLPILFGAVIDNFTPQTGGNTLAISPHAYAVAFIIPTLFSAAGIVGSLFIRERRREEQLAEAV